MRTVDGLCVERLGCNTLWQTEALQETAVLLMSLSETSRIITRHVMQTRADLCAAPCQAAIKPSVSESIMRELQQD